MSAATGAATLGPVRLTWGAHTDRGRRRESNEDAFLAHAPVFAVADGMGGHLKGEVASAAAVDALARLCDDAATEQQLRACLDEAQAEIMDLRQTAGRPPGTTVSGLLLVAAHLDPAWLVFNIGDSRTYRYADGRLTQVSVDHTVHQEDLDAGRFPDPRLKHVITRALGAGSVMAEPDTFVLPARDGERWLICSDGLSGELEDPEISMLLGGCVNPQEAAELLVAQACEHGGRDNVTVVVIDVALTDLEGTAPVDDLDNTQPTGGFPVVGS